MIEHWEALGKFEFIYIIAQYIPIIFIGCMIAYAAYIVYMNSKNKR